MTPLEIALKEYGTREITGIKNNPRILQFSKEIGAGWVQNDETPWCAIFMQWCLKQANKPFSYMANARYFINYGTHTETPEVGDIVVLWRGSKQSTNGHVGFFITQTEKLVYILGGNQGNSVNITAFDKSQVLDYRKIPIAIKKVI